MAEKPTKDKKDIEQELNEGLEDSFPGSDPVSITPGGNLRVSKIRNISTGWTCVRPVLRNCSLYFLKSRQRN
jgi:hypothetical protein